MGAWIRKTMEELRRNTAKMDRRRKAEYVLAYYWHYLLFASAAAGLLILLVRHLFFAPPPKALICVLVNQQADYERDERLARDFSEYSGISPEEILVDSDYLFSYGDVRLEAANESSYEKFFFRWGSRELDAVLMPESFYRYCKEIEYEFADLRSFCTEEQREPFAQSFLKSGERYEALYAEHTRLTPYLRQEGEDRLVLAFVPESGHPEADAAFLRFVLEGGAYEEDQH